VSGKSLAVVVAAVALAITGFVVTVVALGSGDTVEVVIPAGTGAAVDAGESVEAVPAVIEVSVGDTLVLVNDDTRPHVVGPWTVLPGQQFSYRFDVAEEFTGACSAHPDNAVRIVAA